MSTTLLTVPPRVVIMLMDSDARVRDATDIFPNDVDNMKRPFWYVAPDEATYPPGSAGVETPDERYTLELINLPFGQGGVDNEAAEQETRELVDAALEYLFAREQLQYSNLLAYEAKALPALKGVKWARPVSRTRPGVRRREGVEGEYWGGEITLAVQSAFAYEQILVANT